MDTTDLRPRRKLRRAVAAAVCAALSLCVAQTASAATLYSDVVINDGASVYYRFNESTGAVTATDRTNHHNGTYANATLGLPGALNDRTTAVLNPNMTATFSDAAEQSVEFWAKGPSTAPAPGTSRTWIQHGLPGQAGWSIIEKSGSLDPYDKLFLTTPQGTFPLCDAPAMIGDGGWHYYAVTWSGRDVSCSQDGGPLQPVTAPVTINGAVNGVATQFTVTDTGQIDELALYPNVLTNSVVTAHYNDAVIPYVLGDPQLTDMTVAGRHRTGDVERSSTGSWSGAFGDASTLTYSYTWQRCSLAVSPSSNYSCSAIAGATGQTYQLTDTDIGSYVRSVVTATNSYGSVAAPSIVTSRVQAIPPAVIDAPSILPGTAQEGNVLDSSVGNWSGTAPLSYSYQWKACTSPTDTSTCTSEPSSNSTAREARYWIGSYDVGKYLRLSVTASNSAGSATQLSAATAQVVAGDACETLEGCELFDPTATAPDVNDAMDPAARNRLLAGAVAEGATLPRSAMYQVGGTGSALVAAGRVTDPDGLPGAGEAAVFAVPTNESTDTMIPIGQVDLGPDGSYAISTPLTTAIRNEALASGGALNLQLEIFTQKATYAVMFVRVLAVNAGQFEMTDVFGKRASTSEVRLDVPPTDYLDPQPTPTAEDVQRGYVSTSCPGGRNNCTYSAWNCVDDGAEFGEEAHATRIAELHSGSNFKTYIEYAKGGASASGAGTVFGVAISDSPDAGFYASGEMLQEHSVNTGASNEGSPVGRDQNKYMTGRFIYAKQRQQCARNVFYHGQQIGRQYKKQYVTRAVRWDTDLNVGADTDNQISKTSCRNSIYVHKWPTRKAGDAVKFWHQATNTRTFDHGYNFLGVTFHTVQSYTGSVTTGVLLQKSDGGPYIVCGTNDQWDKAAAYFAGS